MKRDDFGMRISEIRELATKYSKNDLARMVQMGMIEPQKALMAGMMIERIAKSAMQPPQTTVVEDVLTPAPTTAQGQIPEGIMAAPGAPAPSSGVAALPSGIREMAGGGIVAFADGGDTDDIPGYANGNLVSAADTMRGGLASQQPVSGLPTLPGGFQLREYAPMEKPTLGGQFEEIREAERMAGVDTTGLMRQMREEELARREELKGRKEEAKGEALLMAGLGLMGARRGQEFETLAGVSRQALAQYGGALREIRETERDIKKNQRELALAEDKLKRDQSGKALESLKAKATRLEDLGIRQTDQYNQAIENTAKLLMDEKKIDKETATRMAIAQIERDTRLEVERMQTKRAITTAGMPDAQERIISKVLADLKKTNPNATYADAVQAVKSGASSSAGVLADKAYDNVMKRMETDFKLAAEVRKDPTALDRAIEAETKRLQTGGGSPTSRPPTTFNLSPEAQRALQQYGVR